MPTNLPPPRNQQPQWWRSRIFWEAIIAIAVAMMITGVIASVRFAFG
jgi:hypothetical protein